jgi:hypothetical protein
MEQKLLDSNKFEQVTIFVIENLTKKNEELGFSVPNTH